MGNITEFRGDHCFLSNFYYSDIKFKGTVYKTSEHLFQAAKATNESDRERIIRARTPKEAKYIGKRIRVRHDWEEVKEKIMYHVIKLKFQQNHDLKTKLLATKDDFLIEGNFWHDNYWGNCYCDKCLNIHGLNKLGQLLMRVRRELLGSKRKRLNKKNEEEKN